MTLKFCFVYLFLLTAPESGCLFWVLEHKTCRVFPISYVAKEQLGMFCHWGGKILSSFAVLTQCLKKLHMHDIYLLFQDTTSGCSIKWLELIISTCNTSIYSQLKNSCTVRLLPSCYPQVIHYLNIPIWPLHLLAHWIIWHMLLFPPLSDKMYCHYLHCVPPIFLRQIRMRMEGGKKREREI